MKKCSIDGCERKYWAKGLCEMHYMRVFRRRLAHDLSPDPMRRGVHKGENNPNWKGGVSEYPNHSEMKRMRKIVLEEENYTCHYCGNLTNKIHHKDLSKDNHKRENLTACCNSCNLKFSGSRTSKFTKLYGKNLAEISKSLSVSIWSVWNLHKVGKLSDILSHQPSGS